MTSGQGQVPTGWAQEVVVDDAAFRHRHRQYGQALQSQAHAASQSQSASRNKRKREHAGDASILHGKGAYKGPWARFHVGAPAGSGHGGDTEEIIVQQDGDDDGDEDGSDVEIEYVYEDADSDDPTPTDERDGEDDDSRAQFRQTATDYTTAVEAAETTTFHGQSELDYQGRTYMHIPTDVPINLRADMAELQNFIPKKVVHTWKSHHPQAVTQLRFLPDTGHLLMSASADGTVKLYDVYHKRDLLRTFAGHGRSVNDICFNNDGTRFISSSYDRTIKLWDTETGACLSRFSTGKTAHVVRFNPDPSLNHEFVAGMSDKKIVQFDTRLGSSGSGSSSGSQSAIVQEYDHHLGPVNTITFCDQNRRFITTSDDKSLRAWEYGIPVPIKFIAEPYMFPMVRSAAHPNGKFVAFQSLDDQIVVYACTDKFRQNRKKQFEGHHNAGYAVDLSFSPDGAYLTSGDSDGKVYVWDWKTCKVRQTIPVSDGAVLAVQWHPRETSKMATGDLNGLIKYWD